jgi:hypothetical protein
MIKLEVHRKELNRLHLLGDVADRLTVKAFHFPVRRVARLAP